MPQRLNAQRPMPNADHKEHIMPKPLAGLTLAAAAVLILTGIARADVAAEPIPPDALQQLVPFVIASIQMQFPTPPVKVDAVADKAVGLHVMEKVGLLAIP